MYSRLGLRPGVFGSAKVLCWLGGSSDLWLVWHFSGLVPCAGLGPSRLGLFLSLSLYCSRLHVRVCVCVHVFLCRLLGLNLIVCRQVLAVASSESRWQKRAQHLFLVALDLGQIIDSLLVENLRLVLLGFEVCCCNLGLFLVLEPLKISHFSNL
jgi:hypothetical protein